MIPNEIMENNRKIRDCSGFRSVLYAHDFYNKDILNEFVNDIKNSNKMDSYISSYYINTHNQLEPEIRLTLRKAYFNRFGNEKFNAMAFYQVFNDSMRQLFLRHSYELISILGKEVFDEVVYSDKVSLIYNIYRVYDNIIVIEP